MQHTMEDVVSLAETRLKKATDRLASPEGKQSDAATIEHFIAYMSFLDVEDELEADASKEATDFLSDMKSLDWKCRQSNLFDFVTNEDSSYVNYQNSSSVRSIEIKGDRLYLFGKWENERQVSDTIRKEMFENGFNAPLDRYTIVCNRKHSKELSDWLGLDEPSSDAEPEL